jgi:hypothetical protein
MSMAGSHYSHHSKLDLDKLKIVRSTKYMLKRRLRSLDLGKTLKSFKTKSREKWEFASQNI